MSTINLFTSSTCTNCQGVKDFFKEHKIPYEEKDIAIPENRIYLMQKGMAGVPVVQLDEFILTNEGNMLIGKLKEHLGIE